MGESSKVPGPDWTEGGILLGRMALSRGRAGRVLQVAVPTLETRALPVLLAALGLK